MLSLFFSRLKLVNFQYGTKTVTEVAPACEHSFCDCTGLFLRLCNMAIILSNPQIIAVYFSPYRVSFSGWGGP